jgi:phage terminase large subunit
MSVLEVKVGPVFEKNWDTKTRITVNQGGSRSSKTYSILQLLVVLAMQEKGKVYSIVRKSLPSLKMTAYRDFFEILRNLDLYDEARHNKSDYTYTLNGNLFEFISLDQPQKKRGARRDYLFCNEANELSWEDFFQLLVRTTGKIWIDYNPSDAFHWIYDKLLTRDDVTYIQSTYKDNPFLDASIVAEIERLATTDEDYWRIYGLGERGMSRATIFQFGTMEVPENAKLLAYGLDFGFTNDPTSLVAAYESQGNLYFDELVYRTGMTNNDIANLFTSLGIDRRSEVYADSAEPKSIEELYRRGFNIKPTTKGPDSVNAGIDIMKRYKLFITPRSTNLEKEMRNYKWVEDKNGNLLNKPIDAFNHAIDAARYAIFSKKNNPNFGRYSVR